MSNMDEVNKALEGVQFDPKTGEARKQVDSDLLLETEDGEGQHVGALNVGMLGLCGPEARERALRRLPLRGTG